MKLALGAALLFLAVGVHADGESRATLLVNGNQAFKAERYAEAASNYYKASLLKPDDPKALLGVAVCEFRRGRTASARTWADVAVVLDPSDPLAADLLSRLGAAPELVLGLQAQKAGEHAKALSLLDKALEHEPLSALIWRARALSLAQVQRLEEAEAAYDKAAELQPKSRDLPALRSAIDEKVDAFLSKEDPATYWSRLGVRAFRRGQFRDAVEPLKNAVTLAPSEAANWYNQALNALQLQDDATLQKSLERCLALEPDHEGARQLSEQRAAAIAADPPVAGLHVYLLAQGGSSIAVSDNGTQQIVTHGVSNHDYLRLSDGWGRLRGFSASVAYSAYATPLWDQSGSYALGEPYHLFEAGLRQGLGASAAISADYNGALRHNDQGQGSYDSNAGHLTLNLQSWGLQDLQLQAQAQRERYYTYADYDNDAYQGTLAATWTLANLHTLQLSLGGKASQATNTLWSHQDLLASANLRLGLGDKALILYGLYQPAWYANYSDGLGTTRFDHSGYVQAELQGPLIWGAGWSAGLQWSRTSSNFAYFTGSSTYTYLGLSYYY